jgi:hypothetical protein
MIKLHVRVLLDGLMGEPRVFYLLRTLYITIIGIIYIDINILIY